VPRKIKIDLEGLSPISFSRVITAAKLPREKSEAYEERCWRDRLHTDDDGNVTLPTMAAKHALSQVAQYLGEKVPGKGQATWTKHFLSGILPLNTPLIRVDGNPVPVASVDGEWLFVPSDGKPGGGTRVMKCFPRIREGWTATVELLVVDDLIDDDTMRRYLDAAGSYIGLGRFRPRRGGYYGRFRVLSYETAEA